VAASVVVLPVGGSALAYLVDRARVLGHRETKRGERGSVWEGERGHEGKGVPAATGSYF
jgi:hypothetical protein